MGKYAQHPQNTFIPVALAAEQMGIPEHAFEHLLDNREIPFHIAGDKRMVCLEDLIIYRELKSKERQQGLADLFNLLDERGLYESSRFPDSDEKD